jgi:hypothetical protein
MSYTQDVANFGREAIDARRKAASYGLSEQAQALRDLSAGGAPSHPGHTPAYDQWLQQQGFHQQDYPVSYGRTTTGKYAGFKNASDLKAALLGRSEIARQQDMTQADALRAMLNDKLTGLDAQRQQALSAPQQDLQQHGTMSRGGKVFYDTGQQADARDTRNEQYQQSVDQWYQQQADPLVTGLETANQIAQTPTRDYATKAGQQYGVDPNLIAGWFPMAQEVTDAATQRNLESLHAFGLPYSEQQSVLGQVQSDQHKAAAQQAADQQLQMEAEIFGATGVDAKALASKSSVPVDQVWNLIQDPAYADAAARAEQALAMPATTPAEIKAADAEFQALIDSLSGDPVLAHLIRAQYQA